MKLFNITFLFLMMIMFCPIALAQVEFEEASNPHSTVTITFPEDSKFETNLITPINSEKNHPGDIIKFKLRKPILSDNMVVIPHNSIFTGTIIDISKTTLLNSTYSLSIDITRLSIPFKGDFEINARPIFDLVGPKKKKSRRFKLGYAKTVDNDLLNTYAQENLRSFDERPLSIPSGEATTVILNEPFEFILKK